MKRFYTVIAALLLLASAVCLTGCGQYVSSYKAVGFVHSNESKSAFMDFYEFEGRMVFRLNNIGAAGRLTYSAKLESGEISVCRGTFDEKRADVVHLRQFLPS